MDVMEGLHLELFQGYDTFTGTGKSTAISGTPGQPGNGIVQSFARVCTSLSELHDSLEVDASVSASYGAFAADAKASYLHTLDVTTNSVTVVIYARKTTTNGPSGPFQLPDETVQKLKTADDIADFVAEHGDSFVSEVTSGSEYIATYTFHSQTKDEQTQVEASLGFKYGGGSTSIDASISTKISNALKTTNVEYSINQIAFGLSSVAYPPQEPDKMIDFANKFSTLSADAPTTVSFKLEPYENHLPVSVRRLFNPVRLNREAFVGTAGLPGSGWAGMLAQLEVLNNECDQLARIYRSYGGYKDDLFESRRAQAQADRVSLLKMLEDVDYDPLTLPTFTIPASLGYGTPTAAYTVVSEAPLLGGDGGNPFQDATTQDIGRLIRLTQVQVYHGVWIDRLIATYTASQQIEPRSVVHGAGNGSGTLVLALDDDECIVSMEGYKNGNGVGRTQVGWLKLVTSKGNTLVSDPNFTPQPDTNYASWSSQAHPGEVIIGFAGRSGDALDAIQPLVLRLSPADWAPNELRSAAAAAAS
jgi:hypothetical protein